MTSRIDFKHLPLPKISIAVCCAIIALALPFKILSPEQSAFLSKYFSYYILLITSALSVLLLTAKLTQTTFPSLLENLRKHWKGILTIILCTLYTQWHIPDSFKILYDEHTLCSTAKNLHYDNIAYATTSQHIIGGDTYAEVGYTDKRPSFFPFLLSLVHDATGYRPENVFYLNGFLGFCLLSLLYFACQQLCDPRHGPGYGILITLLFTSLPLFTQNTNGGGYELLNLCLILCLILCAHWYLKSPSTQGLNLLLITTILLANVRYESILYTLVPVFLLLLKSFRQKRMELTWFSCVSPLLIINPILNFVIFSSNERFVQTSYEDSFALHHLPFNLTHAITYLLEPSGDYSNSLLLSFLGIVSATCLCLASIRKFRHLLLKDTALAGFLCVSLVTLVLTVLALSWHWGAWTDCMTSRFSLPLSLILVLCVPIFLSSCCNRPTPMWLHLVTIGFLISQTTPHITRLEHHSINNTSKAYTWILSWINNLAYQYPSHPDYLYIYDSVIGIGLYNHSTIATSVANSSPEKVWWCLQRDLYQQVYFFEMLFLNGQGYTHTSQSTPINERFELSLVDQHHLTPNLIIRVSSLTGISPASAENHTDPRFLTHDLPVQASADETYINYIKNLPFVPYSFSAP